MAIICLESSCNLSLTTMSSTYAHYQGPSSLPNDYAILSAFNENNNDSRTITHRNDYERPKHPSIAARPPQETTPLLSDPPVPRIIEDTDKNDIEESTFKMFWDELCILAKYAFPVFGTHVLEYSLVVVSVVSIGHISTTALAAISLGSMTASVSGFSIVQGLASALDTLLPSAWTSPHPHLVGVWSQRMSTI